MMYPFPTWDRRVRMNVMATRRTLLALYRRLVANHGPAGWWPGDSALEIALGAILTQNTAWTNAEKALRSLKSNRCLSFRALQAMPERRLAALIRSSGTYTIKARRVKAFLSFLEREYGG